MHTYIYSEKHALCGVYNGVPCKPLQPFLEDGVAFRCLTGAPQRSIGNHCCSKHGIHWSISTNGGGVCAMWAHHATHPSHWRRRDAQLFHPTPYSTNTHTVSSSNASSLTRIWCLRVRTTTHLTTGTYHHPEPYGGSLDRSVRLALHLQKRTAHMPHKHEHIRQRHACQQCPEHCGSCCNAACHCRWATGGGPCRDRGGHWVGFALWVTCQKTMSPKGLHLMTQWHTRSRYPETPAMAVSMASAPATMALPPQLQSLRFYGLLLRCVGICCGHTQGRATKTLPTHLVHCCSTGRMTRPHTTHHTTR